MADDNCLSLFDDDKLRLEELFGDNLLEELLAVTLQTRSAKLKQLKTTAEKGQLENQINAELEHGDISTFIEEKRNRKKAEMGQKCERDKLHVDLFRTDTTD